MANGSELDVTGVYEMPSLSTPVKHKAICECKATKDHVDITQWLKFLGKLLHYEKTENDQYTGCFIALSGVNGYVQDNFNSLKYEKVQLLTGDHLTNVVVDFYKAIDRSKVAAILGATTNRIPRDTELTLYKDDLFWTVKLSDTEFTVVGGDGKLWTAEKPTVIELLEKELAGSKFVDLNDENRLIQRRKDVASVLLAIAISSKGEKADVKEFPSIKDFTLEELKEAAKSLHEQGHIEYWEYNDKVRLPIQKRNNLPIIPLEVWRIIHAGKTQLYALDSMFADELLNDEFLNDVSTLHGDLPIPAERREKWKTILRLCPEAVEFLVNPIPGIVQHRSAKAAPEHQDAIDLLDLTMIEREMIRRLIYDYRKPDHGWFFKRKHRILEMETSLTLKVKTDSGVLLENTTNERHMLAELDSSLGGGYHPILLRPDTPQPWDHEALTKFLTNKPTMQEPPPSEKGSMEPISDIATGTPVTIVVPKRESA